MTDEVNLEERGEIVVDDDVLSLGARASLEQVGSATGFVLALALLFALLPRAALLRAVATSNHDRTRGEERFTRDEERRVHDVAIRERPSNV